MRLEGFLTDQDVNTIKLTEGNIVLEYESSDANEDVPIRIDPRYEDSFFGLEGEGSQNYVIDKESLPEIKGTILKRPVNIQFFTVAKEYDGSPIFGREYFRYSFLPTSNANSGLVMGTDNNIPYLIITQCVVVEDINEGYKKGDTFIINGVEPIVTNLSNEPASITLSSDSPETGYAPDPILHNTTPEDATFNISRVTFPVDRLGMDFLLRIKDYDFPPAKNVDTTEHSNCDPIIPYNISYIGTKSEDGSYSYNGSRRWLELELVQSYLDEHEIGFISVSEDNPKGKRFTKSDIGRVFVDIKNGELPSKNVTNELMPMTFNEIRLVGGIKEDASNNYIINNVEGYGKIHKRHTSVSIKCESKIYDGTNSLTYTLDTISRKIEGDDVYLDPSFVIAAWNTKNTGARPLQIHNPPVLKGEDAHNYYAEPRITITNANDVQIYRRDITFTLDELRILRDSSKFDIHYELQNTVAGDDLWLSFSSAVIVTPSGEEISGFFTGTDSFDLDVLTWSPLGNLIQIPERDSEGNVIPTTQLDDTQYVSIKGVKLKGNDARNYNLTTERVDNIPIRIVNVH